MDMNRNAHYFSSSDNRHYVKMYNPQQSGRDWQTNRILDNNRERAPNMRVDFRISK